MNIKDHLIQRGINFDNTLVFLDEENQMATFPLYNFSGQIVGYQIYNPSAPKSRGNDSPHLQKYFNTVGKEEKSSKIAFWGLESIYPSTSFIFITEGIFDCIKIHNAGYPSIAVLTNNPPYLSTWLFSLSKISISIVDSDQAGMKLRKSTQHSFNVPSSYKDLGDMPQEKATLFIYEILNKLCLI